MNIIRILWRFRLTLCLAAVLLLSSCAWFGANPHSDGLVIPPDTIEINTQSPIGDIETPLICVSESDTGCEGMSTEDVRG